MTWIADLYLLFLFSKRIQAHHFEKNMFKISQRLSRKAQILAKLGNIGVRTIRYSYVMDESSEPKYYNTNHNLSHYNYNGQPQE